MRLASRTKSSSEFQVQSIPFQSFKGANVDSYKIPILFIGKSNFTHFEHSNRGWPGRFKWYPCKRLRPCRAMVLGVSESLPNALLHFKSTVPPRPLVATAVESDSEWFKVQWSMQRRVPRVGSLGLSSFIRHTSAFHVFSLHFLPSSAPFSYVPATSATHRDRDWRRHVKITVSRQSRHSLDRRSEGSLRFSVP